MTVEDLNEIIHNEYNDSGIIALSIVVRDRVSNKLNIYYRDGFGDLQKIKEGYV